MAANNLDKELMQLVHAGDNKAFEQLFKAYYARLVVFARGFILDRDSAQNIVQLVFVKLWEKRETLRVNNLLPYLAIAVRNECLNELKRQKNLVSIDDVQGKMFDWPDERVSPVEFSEKVQEVISRMPSRRQKIFRMNRFEGLKYREIAVALGVSVKTVESQMGKALKFLRENLTFIIKTMEPG